MRVYVCEECKNEVSTNRNTGEQFYTSEEISQHNINCELIKRGVKRQYKLSNSIDQIFNQGAEIIEKKNRDYATESDPFKNFRSAEILGVTVEQAILIRTLDKMSRIGNVLKQGKNYVIEETVEDTILDAINYLAILLAYRRYQNDVSRVPEAQSDKK